VSVAARGLPRVRGGCDENRVAASHCQDELVDRGGVVRVGGSSSRFHNR